MVEISEDDKEILEGHKSVKLEEAVEKALRESARLDIFHFCKIYRHWSVIIGGPLLNKTSPLKLDRRILYILVEDAAYAQHLRYFETNIINLIASPEICGEGIVNKVMFRVGELPKRLLQPPDPPKRKPDPPPPSPASVKQMEEVREKIKDPEIKRNFGRYMLKAISKKQSENEK